MIESMQGLVVVRGGGSPTSGIAVAGELSEEQRSKVLEIADKWPVHRTLTAEINIRTTLL